MECCRWSFKELWQPASDALYKKCIQAPIQHYEILAEIPFLGMHTSSQYSAFAIQAQFTQYEAETREHKMYSIGLIQATKRTINL